jgi:SAM-dependent methyltransferase
MIGRRELPPAFRAWNKSWGAPYGHRARRLVRGRLLDTRLASLVGPFGFQAWNNETRYFEYPWAYHATPLQPGLAAVEIGGGLSGFQFTLARAGLRVLDVDPGDEASGGWPLDQARLRRLNRVFHTAVQLFPGYLEDAPIADQSIDRVFCISTIEHLPPDQVPSLMASVHRILRPGGFAILTVDLFLDLAPFTGRQRNICGTNIDVFQLVKSSGLKLVQGDQRELNGFPSFHPDWVLANLACYQYGTLYPALAQALVLHRELGCG